MADLFENVASKYKNSPSALVLFVAAFLMLVVGANHFAEDVYSSYMGLLAIEKHFNMNVQIFEWTYWTMSISAQLASIVYFYIYLANTDKKWAMWVSILSQFVDFLADLWYRSNGAAFTDWNATIASALITFAFFTIGSEVFITIGAGLCMKLAAPALHSYKSYRLQVERVKRSFNSGTISRDLEENQPKREESVRLKPEFAEKLRKIDPDLRGVKHHWTGKK